jgi:hypothetical protein
LNEFLDLVFTHNDALSGLDISAGEGLLSSDKTKQLADSIKRNIERA